MTQGRPGRQAVSGGTCRRRKGDQVFPENRECQHTYMDGTCENQELLSGHQITPWRRRKANSTGVTGCRPGDCTQVSTSMGRRRTTQEEERGRGGPRPRCPLPPSSPSTRGCTRRCRTVHSGLPPRVSRDTADRAGRHRDTRTAVAARKDRRHEASMGAWSPRNARPRLVGEDKTPWRCGSLRCPLAGLPALPAATPSGGEKPRGTAPAPTRVVASLRDSRLGPGCSQPLCWQQSQTRSFQKPAMAHGSLHCGVLTRGNAVTDDSDPHSREP